MSRIPYSDLDFSSFSGNRYHVTEFDLNAVIREAVALAFAGAAHSGVEVKLELGSAIPRVTMNKIQIQQVLVNLIRNSMEAMASVESKILTLSSVLADAATVEVTIRDTGPGLSPEISAKLFQPFVTTKDTGMGIGLMICQSIVEAHGGRIWALQDGHAGGNFRMQLPLSPPMTV